MRTLCRTRSPFVWPQRPSSSGQFLAPPEPCFVMARKAPTNQLGFFLWVGHGRRAPRGLRRIFICPGICLPVLQLPAATPDCKSQGCGFRGTARQAEQRHHPSSIQALALISSLSLSLSLSLSRSLIRFLSSLDLSPSLPPFPSHPFPPLPFPSLPSLPPSLPRSALLFSSLWHSLSHSGIPGPVCMAGCTPALRLAARSRHTYEADLWAFATTRHR